MILQKNLHSKKEDKKLINFINNNLAIWCPTQIDAINLLTYLYDNNITTIYNEVLNDKYWLDFKDQTCFCYDNDYNCLMHDSKVSFMFDDYKILEYQNFIKKGVKMRIVNNINELSSILNNNAKLYVRCPIKMAARSLLDHLKSKGFTWKSGNKIKDKKWEYYKQDTCYVIENNTKTLLYRDCNTKIDIIYAKTSK